MGKARSNSCFIEYGLISISRDQGQVLSWGGVNIVKRWRASRMVVMSRSDTTAYTLASLSACDLLSSKKHGTN